MVSAWRFRARTQAPAQISNRCGSLFVISSADIRNSGDLQKGVSFVFDAAKPFKTGKVGRAYRIPKVNVFAFMASESGG